MISGARIVTECGALAAHRSKANKGAKLVERKVCYILESGHLAGGQTLVQRLTSPDWQSVGKSFYRLREEATCRHSTVSSDHHLKTGCQYSAQSHLDCFRYS